MASKGAMGKPRILPNSNILAIPHNPAHALTKQLNPMPKGGPNVRPMRSPSVVKHQGVREIFGFQYAGPYHVRVCVEAPSLVCEDRLISMANGCQAQASSLFRHGHRFPIYRVAAPVLSSVPPEKTTVHFIQLVANLLREKSGLHDIYGDGGYHRLYEGGSASHG